MTTIGTVITAAVLCLVLVSVLNVSIFAFQTTEQIASNGNIVVGEGLRLTQNLGKGDVVPEQITELYWGDMSPGGTSIQSLVVTNIASYSMQLSFSTYNWFPVNASQFLTLTWDYDGEILAPNESVTIYFQMYADELIDGITNFNCEIMFTGVQV